MWLDFVINWFQVEWCTIGFSYYILTLVDIDAFHVFIGVLCFKIFCVVIGHVLLREYIWLPAWKSFQIIVVLLDWCEESRIIDILAELYVLHE